MCLHFLTKIFGTRKFYPILNNFINLAKYSEPVEIARFQKCQKKAESYIFLVRFFGEVLLIFEKTILVSFMPTR